MVFLSLITRPSSITDCKQETALSILLSMRSSLDQKGNIILLHFILFAQIENILPPSLKFSTRDTIMPQWSNLKNEQTGFSSLCGEDKEIMC